MRPSTTHTALPPRRRTLPEAQELGLAPKHRGDVEWRLPARLLDAGLSLAFYGEQKLEASSVGIQAIIPRTVIPRILELDPKTTEFGIALRALANHVPQFPWDLVKDRELLARIFDAFLDAENPSLHQHVATQLFGGMLEDHSRYPMWLDKISNRIAAGEYQARSALAPGYATPKMFVGTMERELKRGDETRKQRALERLEKTMSHPSVAMLLLEALGEKPLRDAADPREWVKKIFEAHPGDLYLAVNLLEVMERQPVWEKDPRSVDILIYLVESFSSGGYGSRTFSATTPWPVYYILHCFLLHADWARLRGMDKLLRRCIPLIGQNDVRMVSMHLSRGGIWYKDPVVAEELRAKLWANFGLWGRCEGFFARFFE